MFQSPSKKTQNADTVYYFYATVMATVVFFTYVTEQSQGFQIKLSNKNFLTYINDSFKKKLNNSFTQNSGLKNEMMVLVNIIQDNATAVCVTRGCQYTPNRLWIGTYVLWSIHKCSDHVYICTGFSYNPTPQ